MTSSGQAPLDRSGLALGTVQFGLAYGVAGRGAVVPPHEVRVILETGARAGVRLLDTAPVYGDIEARLSDLTAGLDFAIVSKIAPASADAAQAIVDVRTSVERSRERLGASLETLLFHRAEDLLRADGERLWREAVDAAGNIRVGVSVYDPLTLVELRRRYGVTVAQLPGNAFDQRLLDPAIGDGLATVELHLRSAFLQGLLLMPHAAAAARVPAATTALERWHTWCAQQHRAPLSAALAIARGLPGVRVRVLGVDRVAQLEEMLEADGVPMAAPELACHELSVIDPRQWPAA